MYVSCVCIFSDRCRTTNNMLGDAYGAAVVAALSKKELMAMDQLNQKIKENEKYGQETNGKAQVQVVNILKTSHCKQNTPDHKNLC